MTTRDTWNLAGLVETARPDAPLADCNVWLLQLWRWLTHGGPQRGERGTPYPVLRLRHLLNLLDRQPELRERVVRLLHRVWTDNDTAALFAEPGFSAHRGLGAELMSRLRLRLLPQTPETRDAAVLYTMMVGMEGQPGWMAEMDDVLLVRLQQLFSQTAGLAQAALLAPTIEDVLPLSVNDGQAPRRGEGRRGAMAGAAGARTPVGAGALWQAPMLQALSWLAASIRAGAMSSELRLRMAPLDAGDDPFDQLQRAVQDHVDAMRCAQALTQTPAQAAGPARDLPDAPDARQAVLPQANYLRAVLQRCHDRADTVRGSLGARGVSAGLLFDLDQLQARLARLESVLNLLLAQHPAREFVVLLDQLGHAVRERRGLRSLLAQHHALLARRMAERHALIGEHYLARDRAEYRALMRQAAGGGLVIAGTTFAKFGLMALGMSPFWGGVAAGLNYALSFLVIFLLHWTVATKQPAMTAPALAASLSRVQAGRGEARAQAQETFVDEIALLVRSQMAGVIGNLGMVIPVVLVVQALAWWVMGRPLIDEAHAHGVLHSLSLLGPTPLYAAFTGVLLFGGALAAGWVENAFNYHRLDSALARHPGIVARLGSARAQRWSVWWRRNINNVVSNLVLGLMLGLVPVLLSFFTLPIEVRHVTLSTGQLAAAVGTLGTAALAQPAFWWCVAGIVVTGALNLVVSFSLALWMALRARGIAVREKDSLRRSLWQRLRRSPSTFLWPPRPLS
ncbi:MAG: hypothetical protein RL223_1440 [Pseudomonadota bacterium]|jgi:site-specific recombinase